MRGIASEDVGFLFGISGHYRVVFLSELGFEVIHMSLIMVILHHVKIQADILTTGMNSKSTGVLRLCSKCPLAFIVLQH